MSKRKTLSVTYVGHSGEREVSWDPEQGPLILPKPYSCKLERVGDDIIFHRRSLTSEELSELCRIGFQKASLDGAVLRLPEETSENGEEPRIHFVTIRPEAFQPQSGVIRRFVRESIERQTSTLPWIRSARLKEVSEVTATSLRLAREFARGVPPFAKLHPRGVAILSIFALGFAVALGLRHTKSDTAAVVAEAQSSPIVSEGLTVNEIKIPDPNVVAHSRIDRRGARTRPRERREIKKAAVAKRSKRQATRRSLASKKSEHRKKTVRKVTRKATIRGSRKVAEDSGRKSAG